MKSATRVIEFKVANQTTVVPLPECRDVKTGKPEVGIAVIISGTLEKNRPCEVYYAISIIDALEFIVQIQDCIVEIERVGGIDSCLLN